MTKWEYKWHRLATGGDLEAVNQMGADGWELISVEGGTGYFKRQKFVQTEWLTCASFSAEYKCTT